MDSTTAPITHRFTQDHRACDELWATFEAGVGRDAAQAARAFDAFEQALLHHLDVEERHLFPAFEAATGMTAGPTAVMRREHEQMRALVSKMRSLVEAGDLEGAADQGDTLLLLTQQHNRKEEAMLYPMADQQLGGEAKAVAERISGA